MSSPTEIKLKITLGKNTPINLINYLKSSIEDQSSILPFNNHDFFEQSRWQWMFNRMGYDRYTEPSIKEIPRGWELILHTDINYECGEIETFIDWLKPYVWGRKKKVYLGWYERDWDTTKINIYLER